MDYSYSLKDFAPEVEPEAEEADEAETAASPEVPVSELSTDETDATADSILSESSDRDRKLSVIGRTLVFKGQLFAEEDLLIQGRVEGSIRHNATNLTIGANGDVQADIDAQRVIVQGNVHGDIRASDTVTIEPSARIHGNVYAPRVGLKEGAKFKGSIDMDGASADSAEAKSGKPSANAKASGKARQPRKDDAASDLTETSVNRILEDGST